MAEEVRRNQESHTPKITPIKYECADAINEINRIIDQKGYEDKEDWQNFLDKTGISYTVSSSESNNLSNITRVKSTNVVTASADVAFLFICR